MLEIKKMILSIEFLRLVDTGELAPANHLWLLNQKTIRKERIMSKKHKYNKHLEKGKFYVVNKHPGLIVFKNDKKNIYIAVVTGTSQHKHQVKLKHPTERRVKVSYVCSRPVKGKRKHFGSKELVGMRIHPDDRIIIRIIARKKPIKLK